jgi:hypothetical protein
MFRLRAVGGRLLLALALGLGSLGAGPVAGPTPPETELDPPRCFPHAQLRELAQRAHENPNVWPSEEKRNVGKINISSLRGRCLVGYLLLSDFRWI